MATSYFSGVLGHECRSNAGMERSMWEITPNNALRRGQSYFCVPGFYKLNSIILGVA